MTSKDDGSGGGDHLSVFDAGPPRPAPTPFNIAAHVLAPARETPAKTALLVLADGEGGVAESWSYADLDRTIRSTAAGLRRAGLGRGERVILRLANSSAFPILFFATIAAGGVAVPTSAALTEAEVAPLLGRVTPRFVAFGPGLDLPLPDGVRPLNQSFLAELGQETPGKIAETVPDDPAFLIFTSGTSGAPRGVLHAQRSAWARRMMWDGWYGLGAGDRMLHAGAFNWTYTLGAGLTDPWAAGATALVYAGPRDPGVWRRLTARHEATIFCAVPGVYRQALKAAEGNEAGLRSDLGSLRHGLTAGERMPTTLAEAWLHATGKRLHEALGMTECSTYISGSPARPAPKGTAGFPQPGRRVAILPGDLLEDLPEDSPDQAQATQEPLPRGAPGLLAVSRRDPGLMLGYWQDPQATEAAFRGEWFLTGDRAVMSAEGAITHLGRADDVMNALGYRVSPQEVEEALASHPGVAEVAVAELPVRADLSLVAAFVVPEDDMPGEDTLTAHAEARLAPYKRPRLWIAVDALPRTANGKLIRKRLVAEHRRDAAENAVSTPPDRTI
ncbi:MAG: class I adenylate-forming enzyme family protein [Pseudomonadota bacterium]